MKKMKAAKEKDCWMTQSIAVTPLVTPPMKELKNQLATVVIKAATCSHIATYMRRVSRHSKIYFFRSSLLRNVIIARYRTQRNRASNEEMTKVTKSACWPPSMTAPSMSVQIKKAANNMMNLGLADRFTFCRRSGIQTTNTAKTIADRTAIPVVPALVKSCRSLSLCSDWDRECEGDRDPDEDDASSDEDGGEEDVCLMFPFFETWFVLFCVRAGFAGTDLCGLDDISDRPDDRQSWGL